MTSTAGDVARNLQGIAVGMLCPFDDDLALEEDKLAENATALSDRGIETFLAPANISEYHSLSNEERIRVAGSTIDATPATACILAGVGGSTHEAIRLIEAYEEVGVDAMMVMPPDHTFVHEEGLLEYHRQLAGATDRPLVPYVRGYDPSVSYLSSLSRIDGVVGIKYALPDVTTLGAAIAAGSDSVVWMNGLAEPMAISTWAEGAEGFSAGVSNFRPAIGLALYEALSNGAWERARSLRDCCLPFQRLREESGSNSSIPGGLSVPVVKKGLELSGLHGGAVRPPLRSLTPAEEGRVHELYEELDTSIERLIE